MYLSAHFEDILGLYVLLVQINSTIYVKSLVEVNGI